MKKLLFVALLFSLSLKAFFVEPTLEITQPGIVVLGGDFAFDPQADSETAIRISSSDVVLDLNNRIVTQLSTNTQTNMAGITVDAGVSNVKIRNGFIQDTSGEGIIIGENCSNIKILNITFDNCFLSAASWNGSVGNQITNSLMQNCKILNSSVDGAAANIVIDCTQVARLWIRDTKIIGCGNVNQDCIGISFDASEYNLVRDVVVQNCEGDDVTGILLNDSSMNGLLHCVIQSCTSQQDLFGFRQTGADSSFNRFIDCAVNENTSGNDFRGFVSESTTEDGNFYQRNSVNGNVAGATFRAINPQAATSTRNIILQSTINGNSAVGEAYGMYVDHDITGLFDNNLVSNNTSGGICGGMFFDSDDVWHIRDNRFIRNVGSTDANSFGVNRSAAGVTNPAPSLFMSNIAFANGPTTPVATNQFNPARIPSVLTPPSPASQNLTGPLVGGNPTYNPYVNLALAD